MTVAGHRQSRQEEKRAPALHLTERTKAFRQQAREFSSSPGKPERATWRDRTAKRTPPQCGDFTTKTSPLSCCTLVNEDSGACVGCLWILSDSRCLPQPLTRLKQFIISREVPVMCVRQPFPCQRWQIRDHPDVQLQPHQKPISNGKI